MSDAVETPLESNEQARQLATVLVEGTNEQERTNIVDWLLSLKAVAESSGSAFGKGRRAIEETLKADVIWPVVKLIGTEIKRHAWDERSFGFLLGGGAVIAALAVAGGEAGAGIAALGTATAVPLWLVFGSGGAFAGVLLDEIQKASGASTQRPDSGSKAGHEGPEENSSFGSSLDVTQSFEVLGL